MRLRLGLFLALAVVMMTLLSLSVASHGSFQSKEEKPPLPETNFQFFVTLRRIDWGEHNINSYIEVYFTSFPYNLNEEPYNTTGRYRQVWTDGTNIHMNSFTSGQLRGNVTTPFNLRGPPEYYPLDRYLLNITFTLPSFGLINETNTWIWLRCQEGEFDWNVEPQSKEWREPKFSTITYKMQEWGEEVSLNYTVVLFRASSSTNLIIQVLSICFALVGSLPLIKPDKLEHRLSVCLSLFIFAVTFTFVIPIPTITRATLAETLIWVLLSAAGSFSVLSVVEKALFEVRPSLAVVRYFIEGLLIFGLINSLNTSLNWLVPPGDKEFWVSPLSGLIVSLSFNLIYGYAAVTFVFTFNFIRKNKSRISKRIRAIHLFRR